ncbi:MAG: long-chain fatty acid--CoA ligase [Thermodesulfobacteriota bacterium]|nr:long-chain fatty acid--CoA ligase [Thermodesulfobacteriota bacterium]
MNIATNLEQAAIFFPDKEVILFEERAITYRELDVKVNQLARGLARFGIGKGERVALFMPNIPEFATVFYAVQKIGAMAVSLNVLLKKDEVKYILEDCGARIIFASPGQALEIPANELPNLEQIVIAEGEKGDNLHIDDLMDKTTEKFNALEMERDDPAAILYTSGTTGFPKGAVLTQSNIVSNVNATVYHAGMKQNDRLHLFLPLFHCFGQNFIMNSCIKVGATLVMHRRFEPEPVLKAITRHRVTMFFAVPTIYIYILNMDDSAVDISSLRYCFTAAANMPGEIALKWLKKYKIPINDGYGLTECSPFASYNHPYKYKTGSIGSPVMNVEMKVVDDKGKEAPCKDWGEICIKGPNVMKEYWNKPEATDEVLKDGWLFTGDIGTMDEQGYFYIVDRVKDMINSAGNNIYPAEVENVLFQHNAVHEAAVYGIENMEKGETVKASIVLKPGSNILPGEIIDFCRSKIAKYKAPKEVVFVDELPKSATGKILKRVLREEGHIS